LPLAAAMVIALGAAAASAKSADDKSAQAEPHKGKAAKTAKHKSGTAKTAKHKSDAKAAKNKETVAEPAKPAPQLPPELAAIKQAIAAAQRGEITEAAKLVANSEPAARKLVEWTFLRGAGSAATFERYSGFIRSNPDWPSIPLLRRRAEASLWQKPRDAATVRGFIGEQPAGALGKLALARALRVEGDRTGAEREVRALWRSAEIAGEEDAPVIKEFGLSLSAADHAARMDRSIGAKNFGAAARAAKQLGDAYVAIVKACEAAAGNSAKTGALLDAVAKEARGDLGYRLCRIHWLITRNDIDAAAALFVGAPHEALQEQDTDEWWREGRMLARKLLDRGNGKLAYRVARQAAVPANPYYRAEYHFMAGWIALRFLNEPSTAYNHFTSIDEGTKDPIVLARAAYWRGRAAEVAGLTEEMRAQYEAAASHPTAYYGQLARARLGLGDLALTLPPQLAGGARNERVRAAEILYSIGEVELVRSFIADLAKTCLDVETLHGLGEVTARNNDAQSMLILGKTALARGLPVVRYAFPTIGIPSYKPIAPPIDPSMAFSIVRTESGFDPKDMSPAKAVGLMQVTPAAGIDTAQRFKVKYEWKRLVSDSVYNMQLGAGELSALIKEYAGSYVMTFAGYNAGRGRVKQWVAEHGDPRDPKVDAVDWVERIPLAETRNYVQRVMENLQVYGALFGSTVKTVERNLHRPAMVPISVVEAQAKPAALPAVEAKTRPQPPPAAVPAEPASPDANTEDRPTLDKERRALAE